MCHWENIVFWLFWPFLLLAHCASIDLICDYPFSLHPCAFFAVNFISMFYLLVLPKALCSKVLFSAKAICEDSFISINTLAPQFVLVKHDFLAISSLDIYFRNFGVANTQRQVSFEKGIGCVPVKYSD